MVGDLLERLIKMVRLVRESEPRRWWYRRRRQDVADVGSVQDGAYLEVEQFTISWIPLIVHPAIVHDGGCCAIADA